MGDDADTEAARLRREKRRKEIFGGDSEDEEDVTPPVHDIPRISPQARNLTKSPSTSVAQETVPKAPEGLIEAGGTKKVDSSDDLSPRALAKAKRHKEIFGGDSDVEEDATAAPIPVTLSLVCMSPTPLAVH